MVPPMGACEKASLYIAIYELYVAGSPSLRVV